MKQEKVLSLDVSSKTGYAFVLMSEEGMKLVDYGTIPQIHEAEIKGSYPGNYVTWSELCFIEIKKIIDKHQPDILVIEETSKGSQNAMSQKILEFTHFHLSKFIRDSGMKSHYIMTGSWRAEIGCVMSKAEKEKNKVARAYKKKHNTSIAYDINGKRTGIVGKKHVNIRRANEIFGDQLKKPLIRKDEDVADGLGLAACYYQRMYKKKTSTPEQLSLEDLIKGD